MDPSAVSGQARAGVVTMKHHSLAGWVFVVDHGVENPTDAEWNRFVEDVGPWVLRAPPKLLIRTLGGGPNAAQRARIAKVYRNEDPEVALLSDSAFALAIVTAFRWLGLAKKIRVFPYADVEAAIDHLGLASEVRARARGVLAAKPVG